MNRLRKVVCFSALVSVPAFAQRPSPAGAPAAQATTPVEAQPRAKKGYDYYKAQSDIGSATVQTKDGVIGPFRVISARDSASGLPTGKRMHKPMVITKEIDSSSPMLAAAVARGGAIPGIVIAFDAPSKDASGTDAARAATGGPGVGKVNVQDIHFISVRKISETQEELTFEYASMTVTSRSGGIMSEDDWSRNQ
jgi:type VI secretion system secreted protein Hcp